MYREEVRHAAVLVAMVAACGRIDFAARSDRDANGGDDAHDAPDLGDAAIAACDWSAGPHLGPITHHTELAPSPYNFDPFLVPGDPLTMYFGSHPGTNDDIYVARRPSVGAAFGAPTRLTEINTNTANETGLVLHTGGLHGYVVIAGASNGAIYEVSRPGLAAQFVLGRKLTELAAQAYQFDAWPSADELTMTFSAGPSNTMLDTFTATRPDTTSAWGNIALVKASASGATLTADQRVIVWSAQGATSQDIFYATRATPTAAFGPAQLIAVSQDTLDEHEPSIREDGCELFFAVGALGSPAWSLYSVAITP